MLNKGVQKYIKRFIYVIDLGYVKYDNQLTVYNCKIVFVYTGISIYIYIYYRFLFFFKKLKAVIGSWLLKNRCFISFYKFN